jgi:hypothetical protein
VSVLIRDTWVHTKKLVRSPDDVRVLTDDLAAEWSGYTIRVRAGYSTDGASIPRLAWRLIGHPWGQYLPAAIVHDILYETEIWDREMADQCFRDLMQWLEVPAWRRALMYRAVRTFGGPTWAKHTEASRTIAREFLEIK